MVVKYKQGFTLIEILIVVAIIGILAMIAYPSYTQYVIKTKRVDAQSKMMEISQKLMQYKTANGTYSGVSLTDSKIYGASVFPATGDSTYTFDLSVPNANSWILTATPVNTSTQNGNGSIAINSQGQKCWTKGSSCLPTAATKWE
ncbi:type IV pilin protein [Acinetobacter towneri]|jgi:type IV pilus assembly protein PilE|uniref:Prepilin-type N-terminal cleavage/methylation domain-containing protein n=1 Tax=Acinetobacter towneri TaxID=202956 RepID=A0AAP9GSM3_9GAMM|nr:MULTISPECIES: type IV pilin protein [Acinetobacter]NWK52271.1 prepilin-type N-terminal cleavage/methylation domain-containing protein [Acinetobacter sp. SwsAc5]QGM26660.1 prepilin-type N-terminal cleavage/methylation domain-containing protein [Acinetobacter towneri]HHW52396.1 prepilin-type N-terminal cleavage/methylation domain-containing protein [Acinetobacter towneri]